MIIPLPTDSEAQRAIVKSARLYADTILLKPLTEIGGILSDQLGHWRIRNQARCIRKTQEYVKAKGIKPAKLAPEIFVPLLEEAGNIEDETLSDMLARLLAANLDPNEQENVHPCYAKILGQLSPLDVKVLYVIDDSERTLWERHKKPIKDRVVAEGIQSTLLANCQCEIKIGLINRSMENLERLGLTQWGRFTLGEITTAVTTFGGRLLKSCNDPKTYWRFGLDDTAATTRPSQTSAWGELRERAINP